MKQRRVTSWMISAAAFQQQPPSWEGTGVIASDLATSVAAKSAFTSAEPRQMFEATRLTQPCVAMETKTSLKKSSNPK